jgi:hypothetical protein
MIDVSLEAIYRVNIQFLIQVKARKSTAATQPAAT